MSTPTDATGMADLIVRLRLVEEPVVKELLFELDDKKGSPEPLLRLLERKRLLTPLQTGKLLKGDTDGYFLGGYRVLYRIASGSFGRVYRGDDPSTGRTVAVKILRRRWTEDARRVELFEREGRLGLTLQHPNIVGILAVGKEESTGSHFLVMEFVEGGNLRDILNIRKKVELADGLRIMEECAAGLAFAFQRGLTHRDIKPSNILLGTDGVAKLVDFGLAGINEGAAIMTSARPGEKAGSSEDAQGVDRTVDYAGLEKATNVKQGDVRSDIYFLGHVLYEILTGEPLMPPTKDRQQRMNPRRFAEVEGILNQRAATDGLPPNVRALIAKTVAFEPQRRYQTPEQFYEAVKAVRAEMNGEQTGAAGSAKITGPVSIYVVEQNAKLQDVFRDKLKKIGFRVLISIDPAQAVKRYKQAPFHALLVDAGTSARSAAIEAFQAVNKEAAFAHRDLASVLILNEEDGAWANALAGKTGGHILVRPVTMRQLAHALIDQIPGFVPQEGTA